MKFKYRLASLLKIREGVRTEKQMELNKAYEAAQIVENALQQVRENILKCTEEARQLMTGGQVRVDFLIGLRRHEAFLLAQQSHAENQLKQIQEEIERRRIALMEADREVKVLEKLKEKLKNKFLKDQALAELKQMDEVAGRKLAQR